MQVRLLGPVDVVVNGEPRPVRGLRRSAVLATLALHGGEVVSIDRLVDIVWGENAPSTAVNTLQSHISYVRGLLGSKAAVLATPPGYVLDLGDDVTDVRFAEQLLRQGTRSADPVRGAADLEAALALWRGPPLADLAGLAWLEEQAGRLDLLGLQVKRALMEARLAAGEHVRLVPALEQLAAEHPLDEQIHAQLMLALYRGGRQADALATYHRLRQTLGAELGIDPSQLLRDLEMSILRQDPALNAPPAAAPFLMTSAAAPGQVPGALTLAAVPVPAQLPAAVPAFAGRGPELARLRATLPDPAQAGSPEPATVVISAVSGTAGVGKTALAVHWAHQIAARFPGGQLYVNLRGFDPGGSALDPAEALKGFLDAFGVPGAQIPAGVPARAALYRSVLDGRQVLVLLDNARDAEQVRPLLPGSPGCLAIVTSRDRLTGLVATEGAYPVALGLLTPAEARTMLTRRLGAKRVSSDPGAVDDIIASCAQLPLALAIAAARAASFPAFPLATLATELRGAAGGPLGVLDAGDPAADVRAVFSWSIHGLSDAAAGLFRLLGLHPGPDLTLPAAASLSGLPLRQARESVTELVRASLLSELTPGRYGCHDLLRAFAAELAHSVDSAADRRAAVRRILDHYLHSAHVAAHQLVPLMDTFALSGPADLVTPEVPADHDAARAWFAAEENVLLSAIRQASGAGFDAHTWQLAWTMDTFLKWRGSWREQADVLRTGVQAARRLDDPVALARMLRALARAYTKLELWDEAHASAGEALGLLTELGDPSPLAFTHLQIGAIYDRQDRPAQAIAHAREAVCLYQQAGNHTGQAQALNSLGWAHACLGDYEQALVLCQQALPLLRQAGDRDSEAGTWDSIGYACHHLGDYQQAVVSYQNALELARAIGNSHLEADILDHLSNTLLRTASYQAAQHVLRQAFAILDRLGHPSAASVQAKLARTLARAGQAGGPAGHQLADRLVFAKGAVGR